MRVPDDDAASASMLESLKAEGVLETWKTGPNKGGESLLLVHELRAAAAALRKAGLEHQVFIDDVEKLVEEQKEGIRWKSFPCRNVESAADAVAVVVVAVTAVAIVVAAVTAVAIVVVVVVAVVPAVAVVVVAAAAPVVVSVVVAAAVTASVCCCCCCYYCCCCCS